MLNERDWRYKDQSNQDYMEPARQDAREKIHRLSCDQAVYRRVLKEYNGKLDKNDPGIRLLRRLLRENRQGKDGLRNLNRILYNSRPKKEEIKWW